MRIEDRLRRWLNKRAMVRWRHEGPTRGSMVLGGRPVAFGDFSAYYRGEED